MLHFITKILSINSFTVVCDFNSNEIREINLSSWIEEHNRKNPEFYGILNNTDYFSKMQLDSYGTLTWENGFNFCPDVLYQMSNKV
jgi:hypothetical protein